MVKIKVKGVPSENMVNFLDFMGGYNSVKPVEPEGNTIIEFSEPSSFVGFTGFAEINGLEILGVDKDSKKDKVLSLFIGDLPEII